MTEPLRHQTLPFDADDTLWENNVYFEKAFEDFVEFLNHDQLSRDDIRDVLDGFERANMSAEKHGSRAFAASLVDAYQEITNSHDDTELRQVERFGLQILDIEMENMEGVEETLAALRPHHDLLLVTKGDLEEQKLKLERATVKDMFDAHVIVQEKRVGTYQDITESFDLETARSWMIGNSLRSDIQPALESGLNAILIPHEMTWHLEHVEFQHDRRNAARFVEVPRFRELLSIFTHD